MTAQTLTFVHDSSLDGDPPPTVLNAAVPTALICDNFHLRSELQNILQGTAFSLVEATSTNGSRWLEQVAWKPALVIVAAHQTTARLLKVSEQAKEHFPQGRIVALADQFDLSFVRSGHDSGVNGFCLAASAPDVLIKSLELVMLGETVLPFEFLRSLMTGGSQNQENYVQASTAEPKLSDLKPCELSARETEILGCLMKGEPNEAIARKFGITEATIKVHVKAILRKLGASNRTQAAMWACQRVEKRSSPTS